MPAKFDVVINGKGYVLADTVDPSIPFRTHRAIYDITPTFVERSNTSNQYGDQAQDFFLTASQRDWSLGSEQSFFRSTDADSVRKFYTASAIDCTSKQGQITGAQALTSVTNLAAWKSACGHGATIAGATASNLHTVDSTGTLTDQGAHGAGSHSGKWGLCSDGVYVYIAGATKIQKWDGATFTSFSATASAGALATLNNALYSCDGSTLNTYDGTGSKTTLFTWKDNTNTARAASQVKILPYGGQLLIYFPYLYEGPELWVYDGAGASRLAALPNSSVGYDAVEEFGIVYLSALDVVAGGSSRPAIYYYANGNLGVAYQSLSVYGGLPSASSIAQPPLGSYGGKVAFVDWGNGGSTPAPTLRLLDPATNAMQPIGTLSVPTGGPIVIGSGSAGIVVSLGTGINGGAQPVPGKFYPASTQATTATLQTSQFDFDSSLVKTFRGVKVDWSGSGTVDLAYQIDGAGGSYTNLQTTAVSGTEYAFPNNTTGHTVSIQVTLNASGGVSPIVKRIYVRASPQLSQFRSGTYILDCTGTDTVPRELRDGSNHPLTGYDQVQNLKTAATSTTPFSVTDAVNGTFTGIVDLQDPEGWDVYEVHPSLSNPTKPGSYLVRLKIREV